jgi:hypothetical protein
MALPQAMNCSKKSHTPVTTSAMTSTLEERMVCGIRHDCATAGIDRIHGTAPAVIDVFGAIA